MSEQAAAPPVGQCFEVFTLFPDAVDGFVRAGLLGKAVERGLVEIRTTNYRDFASDNHRTVDDAPFGGGAGMVIKPGPVVDALEHVVAQRGPLHRVLLTPSAPRFDQRAAERLSRHARIGLLCGRYEGIDDRVREHFVDECLSVGDFVLNGGEVAALAVIEAVSRLREGVLGNPDSVATESFAGGDVGPYLEHPQYTRPSVFRGHEVPAVLLGGNHGDIDAWRRAQARARTFALRPDLRASACLPSDVEVHLAVPASTEPSAAFVDLVRRHGVSSVVILGRDPNAVMPWLQATGGRIRVVGFPGLKQLRRRLRQQHGSEPSMVALGAEAAGAGDRGEPAAEICSDPAVILDILGSRPGGAAKALIVVAGLDPKGLGADAVFARDRTDGEAVDKGAQTQDQTLASGSAIEDSSRPSALRVALIDSALTGLLRTPSNDG